jgi:hypothetical protein
MTSREFVHVCCFALAAVGLASCSGTSDSQAPASQAPGVSPASSNAASPKVDESAASPLATRRAPPPKPTHGGIHPDTSPTISGYGSESFVFFSDGTGYTPNGEVWIGAVYGGNWVGHAVETANASGDIANGDFSISVCDETVTLEAYDYSTGEYSNTPQFFVDCIP